MSTPNPFDQFDMPGAPATAPIGNVFDQFDAAQPVTPAAPPETASRVVGLGDRALIQGLGQLVDVPGALLSLADRAGASAHDYIRGLFGLTPDAAPVKPAPTFGAQAGAGTADVLGLPTPATPTERIASKAVSAAPSAVLSPAAPIIGALSAAAGGAASQAVAEGGGSPTEQTIAGLTAGGIPAIGAGVAAGARGLVRGGSQGAAAMQANIDNAAVNGVTLTAGQAGGSKLVQTVESASGKAWGGGAIGHTADDQTAGLANRVNSIVDNLNQSGADLTPTNAGSAINAGVAAAKQSMKAAESAAYAKVDAAVPATTPINVSSTLAKLDTLGTPTVGAEATTAALIPKAISDLRTNMQTDAANGTMPYSALSMLRTKIGNSIDWGFSPSDPVANGQLKQVYGALTDDLNNGAAAVSPAAQSAVTGARSLYAANQAQRDLLNTVVDKAGGPEAVYQAATSGVKSGATKITGVMSALDPQSQNTVRATVLSRLGQAVPSAQNAAGDTFNASTFLTNWNKLAPEAKDALFGSSGAPNTLRTGLDSLTKTMTTLRQSNALANPSGTSGALTHAVGLAALLGEGAGALMGHPNVLAATAGGVAGNVILSRALTNPRTVAWLAQTTKLPTAAIPGAVNQLAQLGQRTNDPDAQALAGYLKSNP